MPRVPGLDDASDMVKEVVYMQKNQHRASPLTLIHAACVTVSFDLREMLTRPATVRSVRGSGTCVNLNGGVSAYFSKILT